ncbi:MAG: SdpI family protein [Chitinophagales bacterium]
MNRFYETNWDYAQKIGGKYMMLFGVVIFIAQTLFGFLLSYLGIKQDLTIPFQLAIMILLLILMLVLSERKLKEFENKGNSR